MSAGGQSGSQNQSGQYSGNTAYNNSGTTNQTGQQTGTNTQSGSQSGTQSGSQTGFSNVNTTGIYNNASQGAAGNLDGSGLTGAQNQALYNTQYAAQNQPINWDLAGLNNTIGGITAGPAPTIASGTAASFMAPYENSYAADVLNPSLNAFDQGVAIQNNGINASRDAGSAFGDRAQVANAVTAGINNTARGALAGTITGQGYQSALGAGATDAGNSLQGQTAQAQAALQKEGLSLQGAGQQAGNLETINNNGMAANQSLYNMGAGGQGQLLNLAGSQTPAFGTSSGGAQTGASNTDFSSVANSLINSLMNSSTTNQGTGTSSGTSSGQGGSSSKGASIPFF